VEESMGQRRPGGSKDRVRFSAEAIERRVDEAHARRGVEQQTERLLSEAGEASGEHEDKKHEVGSRQQRRVRERERGKLLERALRLLERDDDAIRQALERRERLDDVLDGSQPGELDELVWFMVRELKLTKALSALAPPETYIDEKTGEEIERRTMYPSQALNLLGIMSRALGLGSGPEVQAKLLTDERWMGLLGFTSQEVLVGSTRRSEELIGMTRDGRGGRFEEAGELGPARARLEGRRGALSSQTMAGHESALEPEKLEAFFNAVVRALAGQGLFPQEVRASLDSTNEEVPPTFGGAGRARRKVKVASKARRPKQLEVTVLGFKVWYLMCVVTGLPVAFAFDRIEKSEQEHAKALIDQGRANLAGHARLVSVALDRGFLDGDLLWWLKQDREIEWYCPSKEKMDVTAEARERVEEALSAPSAKPALVRYDLYDERSLIENRLNREGKQHFALGASLARTEAAMRSATVFATVALMLHRGLELHEDQAAEHLDRRAEALGVLRYRRQMMMKNRGTAIVVVGERYGRLRLQELLTIAGFQIGRPPPG